MSGQCQKHGSTMILLRGPIARDVSSNNRAVTIIEMSKVNKQCTMRINGAWNRNMNIAN